MSKKVQMYYANLTNIDLAMLMPDGRLRGDSFNLHVSLTGQEDPRESVLIDFSTAKKQIKAWIDDHEGQGFDHKCWVPITENPDMEVSIDTEVVTYEGYDRMESAPADSSVAIVTPHIKLVAPRNCFRFVDAQNCNTLQGVMSAWENEIVDYLEARFAENGQQIEIDVKLTNNMSYPAFCHPELNGFTFRYTHGLKHSTSFGCQNIAHGHLSYIAFQEKNSPWGTSSFWPGSRALYAQELQSIANDLNNKVFVWGENVHSHVDGRVVIQYHCDRGFMMQEIAAEDCIILPVETTIEHIAQFVAKQYDKVLRDMGISSVWVSEGLEKGGVADV